MVTAIIGGTGIYNLGGSALQEERIDTPYGPVNLMRGESHIFLNRHAPNHSVPPHKINYRANIKALEILGVKRVIGIFAVGLIHQNFNLAIPIILDDFIDLSSGRDHTFFDTLTRAEGHVEMSTPFCPVLSQALADAATKHGVQTMRGGVYGCTNGPRFETPAEIRMHRTLGADMVGMTLCPELPLARELGMSYGAVALPLNWGAGIEKNIQFYGDDIKTVQKNILQIAQDALEQTHDNDCSPAKILG